MTTTHPTSSPLAPPSSALTTFLSTQSSSPNPSPTTALPLEILHNLRHQHHWTELRLHPPHQPLPLSSPTSTSKPPPQPPLPTNDDNNDDTTLHPSISALDLTSPSPSPTNPKPTPLTLLSGIPPSPLYTHPSLQRQLLTALIPTTNLTPEREWVIPTTLGRKWSLRELCAVFDGLPVRAVRRVEGRGGVVDSGGEGEGVQHQDAKRVLLAMKAHEGKGGDGTVVYYIVQEGEVKPRQN